MCHGLRHGQINGDAGALSSGTVDGRRSVFLSPRRKTSLIAVVAVLSACAMGGCRMSDQLGLTGYMLVADVGVPCEITNPQVRVRRYRGVIVEGELRVRDFNKICDMVSKRLLPGESLFMIRVNESKRQYAEQSRYYYRDFIDIKLCSGDATCLCAGGGRFLTAGFKKGKLCLSPGSGLWMY